MISFSFFLCPIGIHFEDTFAVHPTKTFTHWDPCPPATAIGNHRPHSVCTSLLPVLDQSSMIILPCCLINNKSAAVQCSYLGCKVRAEVRCSVIFFFLCGFSRSIWTRTFLKRCQGRQRKKRLFSLFSWPLTIEVWLWCHGIASNNCSFSQPGTVCAHSQDSACATVVFTQYLNRHVSVWKSFPFTPFVLFIILSLIPFPLTNNW